MGDAEKHRPPTARCAKNSDRSCCMKYLISALCLAATTATTAFAQSQWIQVGSYHNYGVYNTHLDARLISKEWDPIAESNRVIFQINLQGKDVGAMEFDVLCKTGYFTWERQIVVPTTGARYFTPSSAPHFQKAKVIARDLFCGR